MSLKQIPYETEVICTFYQKSISSCGSYVTDGESDTLINIHNYLKCNKSSFKWKTVMKVILLIGDMWQEKLWVRLEYDWNLDNRKTMFDTVIVSQFLDLLERIELNIACDRFTPFNIIIEFGLSQTED